MKYIFIPKNTNLKHCSDSFYVALKYINKDRNYSIDYIKNINLKTASNIIKNLINLKLEDNTSLFFFSIQFKYIVLTSILKVIVRLMNKDLQVYYIMHEPRYERRRINPLKAYLVYCYNLLFSYLSNKIFLPSDEAFLKATSFIQNDKLCKLNLTFISIPKKSLEQDLLQLKCNWENRKTFALLGTSAKDKNPQGFISLVNIINSNYRDTSRFIRAGRDGNINVHYDEELIIRFPGYMSSSAKKFLFGLTHFVVVPYSFSTQSGVIVEALSHGKLLIINDIPAFSYLKDLDFVFMINFDDDNSILQCINNLFRMNIKDYERRYWESVNYFMENHSESYLSNRLSKLL